MVGDTSLRITFPSTTNHLESIYRENSLKIHTFKKNLENFGGVKTSILIGSLQMKFTGLKTLCTLPKFISTMCRHRKNFLVCRIFLEKCRQLHEIFQIYVKLKFLQFRPINSFKNTQIVNILGFLGITAKEVEFLWINYKWTHEF